MGDHTQVTWLKNRYLSGRDREGHSPDKSVSNHKDFEPVLLKRNRTDIKDYISMLLTVLSVIFELLQLNQMKHCSILFLLYFVM